MTRESGPGVEIRAFVAAAKDFCEFVETASSVKNVSERLHIGRYCLAKLVTAGSALPLCQGSCRVTR